MNTPFEPTHIIIPDLVEDDVYVLIPIEEESTDDWPPIEGTEEE